MIGSEHRTHAGAGSIRTRRSTIDNVADKVEIQMFLCLEISPSRSARMKMMMRMRKILLRIDRVIVLGGLGNEIQSSYFSIRQISTRKTILDYRIVQK